MNDDVFVLLCSKIRDTQCSWITTNYLHCQSSDNIVNNMHLLYTNTNIFTRTRACACVRACMCVRACVRACVCVALDLNPNPNPQKTHAYTYNNSGRLQKRRNTKPKPKCCRTSTRKTTLTGGLRETRRESESVQATRCAMQSSRCGCLPRTW